MCMCLFTSWCLVLQISSKAAQPLGACPEPCNCAWEIEVAEMSRFQQFIKRKPWVRSQRPDQGVWCASPPPPSGLPLFILSALFILSTLGSQQNNSAHCPQIVQTHRKQPEGIFESTALLIHWLGRLLVSWFGVSLIYNVSALRELKLPAVLIFRQSSLNNWVFWIFFYDGPM